MEDLSPTAGLVRGGARFTLPPTGRLEADPPLCAYEEPEETDPVED